MVRFFLALFILGAFFEVFSQSAIKYPDQSFGSEIRQRVGNTTFIVNYDRPEQRGRIIFGGLVPYGKVWKTGAGFHNRISFDKAVTVEGRLVKEGTYHLVTIPGERSWKS